MVTATAEAPISKRHSTAIVTVTYGRESVQERVTPAQVRRSGMLDGVCGPAGGLEQIALVAVRRVLWRRHRKHPVRVEVNVAGIWAAELPRRKMYAQGRWEISDAEGCLAALGMAMPLTLRVEESTYRWNGCAWQWEKVPCAVDGCSATRDTTGLKAVTVPVSHSKLGWRVMLCAEHERQLIAEDKTGKIPRPANPEMVRLL